MSKKNKKKLRKILRSQMAQNTSQKPEARSQTPEIQEVATEDSNPEERSRKSDARNQMPEIQSELSEDTKPVKREIRKILLTVLGLLILIVAIYLINIKTDFILKLGEWLAKILNINV